VWMEKRAKIFMERRLNSHIQDSTEFTDFWMDDITTSSKNSTRWLDLSGPWTLAKSAYNHGACALIGARCAVSNLGDI
jgi:hypothetical protein